MTKVIMEYKYILFNKPYGVLCQFTDNSSDEKKRPTLKEYIDVPSVYPAGRLDLDSEGLLLLTDDGILKHRLCHPKFAHPRTYWVQVERIPDRSAIEELRAGVNIKNYRTRKAKVKKMLVEPILPPRNPPIRYRKNVPTCWLEITLTEGRNRQVRRMTAAVGYPTLRLVRVAIGITTGQKIQQLRLDDLKSGQWRYADITEKKALKGL